MRMGRMSAIDRLPAQLLLLMLSMSVTGFVSAGEVETRPWGRLNKPTLGGAQESKRQDGYLGRYNPWVTQEGSGTDEAPRYRQQEQRSTAQSVPGYPSPLGASGYPPLTYPPAPGPDGNYYRHSSPPYSPYPGLSPWNGGLNPHYGNYWNDPYGNLQPDTGILWSDMWR